MVGRLTALGIAAGAALVVITVLSNPPSADPVVLDQRFDREVIEAGRTSIMSASGGAARSNGAAASQPAVEIAPTLEGVLTALEGFERTGFQGYYEALQEPDADELTGPLIEVLEDEAQHRSTRWAAVTFLTYVQSEGQGGRRRPLPPGALADRIFDAVVELALSGSEPGIGRAERALIRYTTTERLERLVELIEETDGATRSAFIKVFCGLTNAPMPQVVSGFCGSVSRASVKQAHERAKAAQEAAVPELRAWWEENKNKRASWARQAFRPARQHPQDEVDDLAGLEERLDDVRGMLSSVDPARIEQGLQLVVRDELVELTPEVIDVFLEPKARQERWGRRSGAAALEQLGIPGLDVELAISLIGRDLQLDLTMAEYLHGKHGSEAMPLLEAILEIWNGQRLSSVNHIPPSAAGMLRALLEGGVSAEEMHRDLARRFFSTQGPVNGWIPLLGIVEGNRTAPLLGMLLARGGHEAAAAAGAIERLRLTEFADHLAAQESPAALSALCSFGDRRAIDAVLRIEAPPPPSQRSGMDLRASFDPGALLARLKPKHGDELRSRLTQILEEDDRDWHALQFTLAIAASPTRADEESLKAALRLQTDSENGLRIRRIAAVALARLGDRSALPALQRMAREELAQKSPDSLLDLTSGVSREMYEGLREIRGRSWRSEFWRERPPFMGPAIREWPEEDVGLALRALGDEQVVQEATSRLVDEYGTLNVSALRLIGAIIGKGAIDVIEKRLADASPTAQTSARSRYGQMLIYGLDPIRAMELTPHLGWMFTAQGIAVEDVLPDGFRSFIAKRFSPHGLNGHSLRTGLELLCLIGDRRGIDLALEDPLLLDFVMWSVDAGPPRSSLEHGLTYNRVEDALRFRAWWLEHRDEMVWDQSDRRWRLGSQRGSCRLRGRMPPP